MIMVSIFEIFQGNISVCNYFDSLLESYTTFYNISAPVNPLERIGRQQVIRRSSICMDVQLTG